MAETNSSVDASSCYRVVPGFADCRVSDAGEVQRRGRDGSWRSASITTDKTTGYCCVQFRVRDGRRCFKVHTLVLLAFVGPCPPGMECRHLNDVKTDNRLCNLTWGTPKQNAADRKRNGRERPLRGEDQPSAKLVASDVLRMRADYWEGVPPGELVKRYGVGRVTVQKIITGKTWSHLPMPQGPRKVIRRARMTSDERRRVFEMRAEGFTQYEIAAAFRIDQPTISRLLRGVKKG